MIQEYLDLVETWAKEFEQEVEDYPPADLSKAYDDNFLELMKLEN